MAAPTPLELADMLLVAATAVLYGYVGWRLASRDVHGEARLAWDLFTQWWYGLAAITAVSLVPRAMTYAGVVDAALYMTITHVTLIILCYVMWALLYYLLYLFTGRRSVLAPVTAFYLLYYVFLLYVVISHGMYYDADARKVDYATEITGPTLAAVVLLLLVPHILGAVGYFTLYFRATEPTQRYRIGLIAWSIIAWFSTSLVGSIPVGEDTIAESVPGWRLITRFVGLAAACAILLAYLPPRWVRDRYGVESVDARTE